MQEREYIQEEKFIQSEDMAEKIDLIKNYQNKLKSS